MDVFVLLVCVVLGGTVTYLKWREVMGVPPTPLTEEQLIALRKQKAIETEARREAMEHRRQLLVLEAEQAALEAAKLKDQLQVQQSQQANLLNNKDKLEMAVKAGSFLVSAFMAYQGYSHRKR